MRVTRLSRLGITVFVAVTVVGVFAHPADATHFRYGHLTWKERPDVSPMTVEFSLTNAFRRGDYPGTGPDGRAVTGDIIDEGIGNTSLFFGDGTSTGQLHYRVIAFDPSGDWVIGIALDPTTNQGGILHSYPSANNVGSPWIAAIDTCCRISSLANYPGGRYRVETLVDLSKTLHSPVSSLPPIVSCPENSACGFTVPAADPEPGTTLLWRLATPAEDGGIPQPSDLVVDSSSGALTWQTAGAPLNTLWARQVVIEKHSAATGELLTKVAVDFLTLIVPPGDPPTTDPEPGSPPLCSTTVPAFVGQSVSFTVTASDPNPGDVVTLNSAGLPGTAITIPELPATGNPISVTFTWTPTSSDVGTHVVSFTATDTGNLQVLCPVTIDVQSRSRVTVLVHGFRLMGGVVIPIDDPFSTPFIAFNPIDNYWGEDKIAALLNRVGGGVVYVFQPATGDFQIDGRDKFYDNFNANGEIVLVYDWARASNDPEGGQAEAAADALFASLIAAGYADPTNPAQSSHFHFIGHSRGCPVVSETVQRLGLYDIPVDYVTNLDPHDFGQPYIDTDEFHHDPAVQVWSNVLYADNYFQRVPWDFCLLSLSPINPAGRALVHIADWPLGENRDISNLLDDLTASCFRPHSRVIDYYWGTITPGTEDSGWYPDGTGATSGFSKWFDGEGYRRTARDSSLVSHANPKTLVGVVHYRWGIELGTLCNKNKADNKFCDDDGVPPLIFMGNFDLPDLESSSMAGWKYHGGEGGGERFPVSGTNYCLRLRRSLQPPPGGKKQHREFRRHNRLYFPAERTQIKFGLRVAESSPDDVLVLSIGNTHGPNPISLTATITNFVPQTVAIPASFANTVNTFKFEIIDLNGDGIQAVVDIDNIELTAAADLRAADLDPNQIETGYASAAEGGTADTDVHNPGERDSVGACGVGMFSIGTAGLIPLFLFGLGRMKRTRTGTLRRRG